MNQLKLSALCCYAMKCLICILSTRHAVICLLILVTQNQHFPSHVNHFLAFYVLIVFISKCRIHSLCHIQVSYAPYNELKKLPHFFAPLPVSSLPSSDIMPGYTASHSACKKTTNLRAKFYGKTAMNGEIPVNKYQNNINHMS